MADSVSFPSRGKDMRQLPWPIKGVPARTEPNWTILEELSGGY